MPETSPDPKNARKLDAETAVSNPLDAPLPNLSSPHAAVGIDMKRAASDALLARELAAAGNDLPEGRREAVASLLTGLMADTQRLDDYVASLKSEFKDRGASPGPFGLFIVEGAGARIAAEGFSKLNDDQLAALAASPKSLRTLHDRLGEPETQCGDWFPRTVVAAHVGRPEVKELADHARARVARLQAEHDSSD